MNVASVRFAGVGLATMLVTAGCGLIPRTYEGQPLDPSAPDVRPAVGRDAATIETKAPKQFLLPGDEGAVLFIRLVDEHGQTILDRPFEISGDRQGVPPGRYTLTGYWRGCDANCGNLSQGETVSCRAEVSAQPRGLISYEIKFGGSAFGGCAVSIT